MPSAHAIKTWVNNFEDTGSTVKKKGGSVKTVKTDRFDECEQRNGGHLEDVIFRVE